MPDGSAGHPLAHTSEGRGLRSKRVSADGIQDTVTLPDSSREHKALIPRGLGTGATARGITHGICPLSPIKKASRA